MKDNINSGLTLNRKIVIEIRFKPIPKILDLKGAYICTKQQTSENQAEREKHKRTFYSIVDGYRTLRIPNVLIREELNKTANFLVEFILKRYYKRM